MKEITYQAKERYQREDEADEYDIRRFTSIKGRLTDKREKACILKALTRADAQGPVLDVPCGTGRMTELLLERGFQVVAGDISEAMMKYAMWRTERYGSQVELVKCDIEDLQFPEESFDLVLTIRLLHHIPTQLHPKILGQLHRVTRRWVVISFSNRYSFQSLRRNFKSLINKSPRYSISPSLFKHEVGDAGFKIVEYLPLMPLFSESVIVLLEKQ